MKRFSCVLFLVLAILALAFPVNATPFSVSQESVAGLGDFDANVLGFIDPFTTGLTTAEFYQYANPNAASYNGELNGGPSPVSDMTQVFLVDASDGLSLVVVHDVANDGSGGNANMQWDLTGDTAALLVSDDSGEASSVGNTQFNSTMVWAPCCTDGYAVGALDGNWAMYGQFTEQFAGINAWEVVDNDFSPISLVLDSGRRVRISSVPEPATMLLVGTGLVGLAGLRRKFKA